MQDADDEQQVAAPPPGVRILVVKTGLARFCRHLTLASQIQSTVREATAIAFEGSKLLNLFLLHQLEHKLAIPKLTRNWIYTNIFNSVSTSGDQDSPRGSQCADVEHVRQTLYLPNRHSQLSWPQRDLIGQVLKRLSQETYVNCSNHVFVNFRKRIRRWWFGKLSRKLRTQLERRNRWRLADVLVTAVCSGQSNFGMPGGIYLDPADIHYIRNTLIKVDALAYEDRKLCPIDPSSVTDAKLKHQVGTEQASLAFARGDRT